MKYSLFFLVVAAVDHLCCGSEVGVQCRKIGEGEMLRRSRQRVLSKYNACGAGTMCDVRCDAEMITFFNRFNSHHIRKPSRYPRSQTKLNMFFFQKSYRV